MGSQLDGLFDKQAEETVSLLKDSGSKAAATNERTPILPGFYVAKVNTFAWKEKDGTMRKSPEFTETRNGAITLNINIYVDDEGTEAVPARSSIFHTITIIPTTKDPKKVEDSVRMAKPQLTVLTNAKVDFTKEWLKEYCEVDFRETNSGKFEITKDHKMKERICITVEPRLNKTNNQVSNRVVKIEKYKPGDKSFTNKVPEGEVVEERVVGDTVPPNVDISPSEEKTQSFDTSKITGKGPVASEEDF